MWLSPERLDWVMIDQSWNFLFSFSPNSEARTTGKASVSQSFSRSSRVLLSVILPVPLMITTPPSLLRGDLSVCYLYDN